MLLSAGSLGALLVHDGEVGTDEDKLAFADEGDMVELKGNPEPFRVPDAPAWDVVRAHVHGATFLLAGLDVPVLVMGVEAVPDETVIVHGAVAFHGDHPEGGRLLVIDAQHVDEPFFDWA